MTNSEQLRKEYEAARSRAGEAKQKEHAAYERWVAAAIDDGNASMAAKGIFPGDRVEISLKTWNGKKSIEGIFMGFERFSYGDPRPRFAKITKSGKPHATQDAGSFSLGVDVVKIHTSEAAQ